MPNTLHLSWVVCCLLTACASEVSQVSHLPLERVVLEDANGWVLTVGCDGSAQLAHAHLARACIRWPAKSFSFRAASLPPAFTPREQVHYPYWWSYANDNNAEYRQYGIPDTVWGAAWFQRAYRHLPMDRLPPKERRLLRFWQQFPPLGVAEKEL